MTQTRTNPRVEIGRADHVIEYIGGPRPYYWIGSATDGYFGSIDAAVLRQFVNAPRKFEPSKGDDGD